MTWKEIVRQAIKLGEEQSSAFTKNKDAFIDAANYAQNYICFSARPIIGKYVISNRCLENLIPSALKQMNVTEYRGTKITFSASSVKSYYFECDGNGTYKVIDNDGETEYALQSSGGFVSYRGFANGTVKIEFYGDYAYNIKNVAMYGVKTSANVADIPAYTQYVPYNIKNLVDVGGAKVFMGFAEDKPIMKGNFSDGDSYTEVTDYKKERGDTIYLNRFEKGEYSVWYKKYPEQITATTADDYELTLDEISASVVPLLMAYRLWFSKDPQMAMNWFNLAVQTLDDIKINQANDESASEYVNTSGWA